MISFRITTNVKEDRPVVLTLPHEVLTGQTELVVSVAPQIASNRLVKQGLHSVAAVRFPPRCNHIGEFRWRSSEPSGEPYRENAVLSEEHPLRRIGRATSPRGVCRV